MIEGLTTMANEGAIALSPIFISHLVISNVVMIPIAENEANWDLFVVWQRGKTAGPLRALLDCLQSKPKAPRRLDAPKAQSNFRVNELPPLKGSMQHTARVVQMYGRYWRRGRNRMVYCYGTGLERLRASSVPPSAQFFQYLKRLETEPDLQDRFTLDLFRLLGDQDAFDWPL
jgi:hypothetical protein